MLAYTIQPMRAHDLPDVIALQHLGFDAELLESGDVMRQRFARFGEHFLVAMLGSTLVGYAYCFPWKLGEVPAHNTPFPAQLATPDSMYLQDICLHPAQRGQGLAQELLQRVMQQAHHQGFDQLSLVAVAQTADYWDRRGFAPLGNIAPAMQHYVNAHYGAGARLMVRNIAE